VLSQGEIFSKELEMGILKSLNLGNLGLGCAAISGEGAGYGFGAITETEAIDLVRRAFDQGIRLFDTAPIYGFGTSEVRLGKALKEKREESFIVSKSGVSWHRNQRVNMTNDPEETQKMLDQSLRSLDTDYIDLFMIHWPDQSVDIRKPLEVLSRAKQQQKIKHIGLCNTFSEDIKKASEIDRIEVVQSQLNFFDSGVETSGLLKELTEQDISFMSWGTLDKGILTGRVKKDRVFDKSDARSWADWWKKSNWKEKAEKMETILPAIEKHGYSGVELAMGYNLQFPICEMVLCGARNPDQLEGVVKASNHLPPKNIIEEMIQLRG
jgi:myo-inositol catabolism protein IolS